VTNRIGVVGVGASTAIGLDAPATAAAQRAGIAGFSEHPFMINKDGEPYILATVPSIHPGVTGEERYFQLVNSAYAEALEPLAGVSAEPFTISVIIGLPEQRPGLPSNLAKKLTAHLKSICPEYCRIDEIKTAYRGHAAGLMTLRSANKLLEAGSSQFCLVGGVDSYIEADTLEWLEENEQLHMPSNAWGFMPGEASAFLLLCSMKTAKRFGLLPKAELLSTGYAEEKNLIKTETVCIGEGLTAAVRDGCQMLAENQKISQMYCDQNGEAYRADEHGFMIARLSDFFNDPSNYVAPADCWGDVGAASGLLFVNQICAAAEKNYGMGSVSMLWTSSESGDRAAAVFLTDRS